MPKVCRWVLRFGCGVALVLPALVLAGWILDVEPLKRVAPALVAMNPLTALCFLLCGLSLVGFCGDEEVETISAWQQLAAFVVVLVAALKLGGIRFGFDLGLDQILFPHKLDLGPIPNRMAPTTALNFLLLGAALLLTERSARRGGGRLAQLLALAVALIGLLALVGYCYGVTSLTGIARFIPMALHTAFGFVALACALLCAQPRSGWMARLTNDGAGGMMLRHLLAMIVGAPLLLGWLILSGHRARFYDADFAFSLFVLCVVIVFSALIWSNAVMLDRKESERDLADEALRKARDELEVRVQERTADLSKVIAEIGRGIAVLGSTANEIVGSTGQLAQGASHTAVALSETTVTIEELRQTAQLASEKADGVAARAQTTAAISESGRRAAEEMRVGTQEIRQQMDSIAVGMVRLSEQSRAISEIISAVEDLARQSNLLAVNAAIEAAKAGENGKGFAVVAQAVKFLAEQSKAATAQVRTILGDIQKATHSAALLTEQGNKAVETGVQRSDEAGESIVALGENVMQAANASTQIATSSREQLSGIEQVVIAMQHIKNVSAENLESAMQLKAHAKKLEELGTQLQELSSRYDLGIGAA